MKKEDGMKAIQKLDILSVAYVFSILYAILGIFQGIAMALQVTNPALSANLDSSVLGPLYGVGWWLVLIIPIVSALMGFIGGILFSMLYNLIAKYTGGIKVRLD
jgi:hypothetical protein